MTFQLQTDKDPFRFHILSRAKRAGISVYHYGQAHLHRVYGRGVRVHGSRKSDSFYRKLTDKNEGVKSLRMHMHRNATYQAVVASARMSAQLRSC